MNEDQPQTETPPDLRHLKQSNLTPDLIKSLDRFFRPGPHEIQGMVQSICHRKQWTRTFLSAILRLNQGELRDWEIGRIKPPGVALFAIWHLYMMDTAPVLAFSVIHQATWGKIEQLPAPIIHHIKGEERKKVVEELRNAKERLTGMEIADKYQTTYSVAQSLCKEAGYKPKKYAKQDKRLAHVRMRILAPDSPWMRADWRKKPRELVNDLRASEMTIKMNLSKLRHLPKRVLLRHLKACGCDILKWEPILKYSKQIKRSKSKILFDAASTNTISSLVNETSQEKVPESELHSDAAEPQVSEEVQEARGENDGH